MGKELDSIPMMGPSMAGPMGRMQEDWAADFTRFQGSSSSTVNGPSFEVHDQMFEDAFNQAREQGVFFASEVTHQSCYCVVFVNELMMN
jgi:ribose 1,5-bisphosphokinase PhnN